MQRDGKNGKSIQNSVRKIYVVSWETSAEIRKMLNWITMKENVGV